MSKETSLIKKYEFPGNGYSYNLIFNDNNGSQFDGPSAESGKDIYVKVNADNYDFVLYNGDMVTSIDSEEYLLQNVITPSVDAFAADMPLFMARGNHENRGQWGTHYMDYFPTRAARLTIPSAADRHSASCSTAVKTSPTATYATSI